MPAALERGVGLCVAVVLTATIGGCSTDVSPVVETSDAIADGPWADEFRSSYGESRSDYERAALADGVVTPAELEDAHARIDSCLRDSNLTINYYAEGGFEVASTDGSAPSNDMSRTNSVLESCEARFDRSITYLYGETRRNPERLDDAKITVACLRKAGLVDGDYTEEQWELDYDADDLPFGDFDPQWTACRIDPLGLWWER
ncbi:hypothetical protein DEJ28_03265 [Curtobacterium sp. MCPF17_002]|uniref:hypothetical protein n=1 Tax=Curtobacterium sp. MCPF17_002 TaxID=2175645 RepID=UPI000DA6DEF3|nr:hypothetical protein [Curtobacterium sp. MCPF17_002]WIB78135.1 hypothetical protein DEJ28_03265 [Curtobacterium sp. MCPF17_002]